MDILFWAAGILAAVFHVAFFVVESILWATPTIKKRFGTSDEEAAATQLLAFNQGFYNLFLAAAVFVGLGLTLGTTDYGLVGTALAAWSCLSMLAAGIVLWFSAKHLRLGASVQALPPAIALGALLLANVQL